MKIFISLLILLTLFSCASSKGNKAVDLDDVSNEDFKKSGEVQYENKEDQFGKVDIKESEALNEESIQRLSDPSDIPTKTVLDEIIVACYEKDFEKAFNLIRQNNNQYRQHPIFWNQVGTCFMLKGERRKALLFYNKALEFKSSYAPAFNNLGVMYRSENDDQKALVAFTRSKKSNNLSRTPRFNLGMLYLEYGLYNHSIAMLRGLYNVASSDVDVLAALATAYFMKNDLSTSLSYFSKIDDKYWERPQIGLNYALATFLDNKAEKSRDIFSEVNKENLGPWAEYYNDVKNRIGVK